MTRRLETASLYMTSWDHSFLSRVKKLGIKVDVYKQYVDDVFMILRGISPGWYYCLKQKKLIFDPEHPSKELQEDKRTFLILQEIANQMDPNIQITCDSPSES